MIIAGDRALSGRMGQAFEHRFALVHALAKCFASTMVAKRAPRFDGLRPASPTATRAARGASRKRDTQCELILRRALYRLGLRYRIACADLPGRPDVVFRRQGVVVFCDGDFWHGRNLEARLAKLAEGHNAPYWTAKIQRNVERDREHDLTLRASGFKVLRFWESDIRRDPDAIARVVEASLISPGER